jgi:hypothetical protein
VLTIFDVSSIFKKLGVNGLLTYRDVIFDNRRNSSPIVSRYILLLVRNFEKIPKICPRVSRDFD